MSPLYPTYLCIQLTAVYSSDQFPHNRNVISNQPFQQHPFPVPQRLRSHYPSAQSATPQGPSLYVAKSTEPVISDAFAALEVEEFTLART